MSAAGTGGRRDASGAWADPGAALGGATGAALDGAIGAALGGAIGAALAGASGAVLAGARGAALGGARGAALGGATGAVLGGAIGTAPGGASGAARHGATLGDAASRWSAASTRGSAAPSRGGLSWTGLLLFSLLAGFAGASARGDGRVALSDANSRSAPSGVNSTRIGGEAGVSTASAAGGDGPNESRL
jgi:hypothetical protein